MAISTFTSSIFSFFYTTQVRLLNIFSNSTILSFISTRVKSGKERRIRLILRRWGQDHDGKGEWRYDKFLTWFSASISIFIYHNLLLCLVQFNWCVQLNELANLSDFKLVIFSASIGERLHGFVRRAHSTQLSHSRHTYDHTTLW